ncbi:MAG: hypothetical protein APF81_19010 [Desulfosporosinus sp. BRH_c37]|nr:MAG: hypothetical protein APF81_19010 [Desulfosporosinus sp. BRH_c37]
MSKGLLTIKELGAADKMSIKNESLSTKKDIQDSWLSTEFDMFKSVFDNSSYVFVIISSDGRIKYINSVLPKLLGLSHDKLVNQLSDNVVTKYVHPDDRQLTIQAISEAIRGQSIYGFENRYRVQNGSYIWLSWMFIPFTNEKKIYAFAHEITEQRALKEKLDKSDIKIENILNNISDSVYALDKQWEFIYVNKSAASAFSKVTDQNVLGKKYWDIFPGKDNFYFLKFSEAVLSQKPVQFEALSVLTEGWVTVNVYPSSEGITVYFKDITEQKKLDKSLEDERKRLYALLDGLPGLVYVRTSDGTVIFANHNFKEVHGEPDGKKCYKILFDQDRNCIDCRTKLIRSTYQFKILMQWQIVIKDTIFEVFEHPFQDSDGTQLYLMQLLDITKRKVAEEEIARLDRLNLVGELAASIAHEVRNPMTTVRGFLQILKSRDTLHENEEYFDLMISELDRANGILTEFLSIARTKSKKTEMYSKVKLNNLVNSLYPLILADATNQDKQVILVAEEVAELTMIEREIRQLILNLTRNGLEAMSSGGILKIMTYMEENSIVLAVEDKGIGISEDNIARLGTPFLTTKEGGTGLGLTTCYSIAERHNAKISVESSAAGTVFVVKFKLN